MGKKKATKAGTPSKAGTGSRKPPKPRSSEPRPEKARARRTPEGADPELLAQLLALQERTAEVGRQLRTIGDLVSTVMRDATVTAAEVIDQLGAGADAESAEPPPVAPRPRRRPPTSRGR